MRTYQLVRATTETVDAVLVCIPPRSENFFAEDWQSLRRELDRARPGAMWRKAVFDLENPGRIWLVNAQGRMSHYLTQKPRVADGTCPKCGRNGKFVRLALVCSVHGAFAGL